MTSKLESALPAADPAPHEQLESFLGSFTQTAVVFRYLDLLAERSQSLEQRIGLNELDQLRRENRELRKRLKKSAPVSLDLLTRYLPVIYHNFWNTVRPEELAELVGSKQVPEIPSPYPEPDGWQVQDLKRDFLQLDANDRAEIVAFCHNLPYELKVRRSMRMLLEAS